MSKRSSLKEDVLHKTKFSNLTEYHPLTIYLQSKLPSLLAVYAFGSQVKGCADENSDLDLAVLIDGSAEPLALWELAGQLADIAGCSVDLVDMRATSTVMQYQVLQTGILLWAKQPDTGIFESFVLSEKTALDTARAGVLSDIKQRGRVYG